MDVFNVELAGMAIEIRSRFRYCRWFCREYLTDEPGVFSVEVSDERLAEARVYRPDMRDEFIERDVIYAAMASKFPYYNRVMLHGACISYKGRGYMFTAVSGTGKSTHIGLWKKYIGEGVDIVNGDKPVFSIDSEKITAYDTPWCGKEGWNRKQKADMGAICFIGRSGDGENRIRRITDPEEAVPLLLKQMFHPYEPEATGIMLELFDNIIERLPLYILECDMSEEAVKCSFEAMTGEKYISRGVQTDPEEIDRLWKLKK